MKRSAKFLVALAGTSIAVALIDAAMHVSPRQVSPLSFVYGIVFASLIFQWSKAYTSESGLESPLGVTVLAAFLPPVGIPILLFRLLSIPKAVWASAKAVAFAIALLAMNALVLYGLQFASA